MLLKSGQVASWVLWVTLKDLDTEKRLSNLSNLYFLFLPFLVGMEGKNAELKPRRGLTERLRGRVKCCALCEVPLQPIVRPYRNSKPQLLPDDVGLAPAFRSVD